MATDTTDRNLLFGLIVMQSDLLGMLVSERFRFTHPAKVATCEKPPHVRPMDAGLKLFGRRRDGSEIPVKFSLSSRETDEGLLLISTRRDITQLLGHRSIEIALTAFSLRIRFWRVFKVLLLLR